MNQSFLFLSLFVFFLSLLQILSSSSFVLATIRPLQGGEILLNVLINGGGRTDIAGLMDSLSSAISMTSAQRVARVELAGISYPSSQTSLFEYIIREGDPTAMSLAIQFVQLSDAYKNTLSINSINLVVTTTAAPVSSDTTDTLRTVLIIAGGATGGALLALVVAAIFCKPRASEAEEKKMREKQDERKAKAEAEMQVQQLVRSAAFQRLQERVIDLEKEESVRKAVGEVEEQQRKNKNISKTVARQLLDEPFVEPQDRQIDKDVRANEAKLSKMSEADRRKQRAIDIVENAPWWQNAAIQAEITAGLAMPKYVGMEKLFGNDDGEDEDEDDLDNYFGANAAGGHTGEVSRNVGIKNQKHTLVPKRKKHMAKIPDHLIDFSAIKVIAEGHHWLSFNALPKCSPAVEAQVMLAKSNLHGLGVFARRFIDRGTLLFPWANPSMINSAKHVYSANEMRYHFGNDWDARLHFVARDGYNKKFCVAEDPKSRGWGCAINSCRGTGGGLVANCECVFPDQKGAGVIPWVRVTQTIAPLGELLLDYPFPELIQQQRGLNPNQFDEPPIPSFSTYGASLNLPLMNASYGGSAPVPRQHIHDPCSSAPPPPPPPPPPPVEETPPAKSPAENSRSHSQAVSITNNNQDLVTSPRSGNTNNNNNNNRDDDGAFTLDVEPLQKEATLSSPREHAKDGVVLDI